MSSIPTWAVWAIVVPFLLSPVLAFLLAIAAEIVICALVDIGRPAVLVLGIGAGALVLFRTLRVRARRAAPGEA